MSILDNTRLMVKVCKMFYEDGYSQKEISASLEISRPQICRIINAAKEKGILNISITNPYSEEFHLEKKLVETYGLKDAFVVDIGSGSSQDLMTRFAKQCAAQLENYIPNNVAIGVMSGKTIGAVAQEAQHISRDNLHFVPLVGGLGTQGNDWNANSIARILAYKSNSTYSVLNAPILVKNEFTKDILIKEPDIEKVLKQGESCSIAIVGIGQISTHSTAFLSGAFQEKDLGILSEAGAAASVSISYLDCEGKLIDCEITRRSIAWPLKKRKNTKIIGIAMGDSKKEAVKATLKGGYLDILMTSLPLAKSVL